MKRTKIIVFKEGYMVTITEDAYIDLANHIKHSDKSTVVIQGEQNLIINVNEILVIH